MDHRGTMLPVQFLLTIILAFLIFVPACMVVSNILGLEDQARNDFLQFVGEVKDFSANANIGQKESFVLIMDKGSSILFYKEKKKLFAYSDYDSSVSTVVSTTGSEVPGAPAYLQYTSYYLEYPVRHCEDETPCACLCRDFADESTSTRASAEEGEKGQITHNRDITCENLICQPIPDVSLTHPWRAQRTEGDAKLRRQVVELTKTEQGVLIELQ